MVKNKNLTFITDIRPTLLLKWQITTVSAVTLAVIIKREELWPFETQTVDSGERQRSCAWNIN